ncbi:MAG: lysophospholipid acyltransferase family protein [Bacteroidales bacterium]|jgi:KDO2-lipid IV(A) lauroyltransferase|nr:lysophospholipid acyltransferase family protein [Bacteroidales bacterium]
MMLLLYGIVYGTLYGLSLLPFPVLYALSSALYYPLYYCVRYRRKIVRQNLLASFPDRNLKEIIVIEKRFYAFFCDYVVETLKLLSISHDAMRRRMTFGGMEAMKEEIIRCGSCCLYLGHYGNWEWISSLGMYMGGAIHAGQIYMPLQNPVFDRLFLHLRGRFHAENISWKNTLRRVITLSRANKPFIIGFISDQTPQAHSIHHKTEFLHRQTSAITGAERIARQLKSSVFYADITRIKRGYYHCELIPVTASPQDMPEFELTDRYFRLLEATIRRNPPLWLWSHNRWKR